MMGLNIEIQNQGNVTPAHIPYAPCKFHTLSHFIISPDVKSLTSSEEGDGIFWRNWLSVPQLFR